MSFRTAHLSVSQSGKGDDRCAVIVSATRVVIAVADGAGGSRRGAEAAEAVLTVVNERNEAAGSLDLLELLRDCDIALAQEGRGGETTAVVVIVDERGVTGASVGDSGAWLVDDVASHVELTRHQVRKPLIGTGEAVPVPFGCGPLAATLLIATDGLLKYGNVARIREIATSPEIDQIPDRLIASVRLRSGALQDDTTVAICRRVR
jgi:PPM family protein phosphatase